MALTILALAAIPGPASAPSTTLQVTMSASVVGFCDSAVWNEVTFRANVSGGFPPYMYIWSFGDGSSNSTAPSPSHSYNNAGMYTANVTVTDSVGNDGSASSRLSVVYPPCVVRATPGLPVLVATIVFLVGFTIFLAFVYAVPLSSRRRRSRP